MALAVIGGMTACSEESGFFDYRANAGTEGLGILPTVSESAQVVTRAESIVELMEKQLNTLDVFVEPVTAAGTFLRQYHLTEPTEADLNLLAERWRNEGLEMGKNYNIYVATNNPLTTSNLDNVEALKALVYDEVTADVAVIDDDNNIGWGTDATSGNIYKLYDAAATNSDRALTAQKEFMMDGVIKNWTPDPTTVDQVFDVTLNRAAAKIVLNVNFSADFLMSLTHDKTGTGTDTTWTPKPPAEQMAITGSPAWRFSNFAFGAPVIAPDTQGDGVEVHNSGFNIFHNQTFEGDDKHFQIITYTYPNKWEQANYATDAPSLVISVPYTQGTVTTYNYYRVPIVMKDTTAIRRNYIYVINATIKTRGSEPQEDEDEIEDVQYAVLPWNDESNSAAIHNEVEAVQHLYLKVNPKVYTLRGDGQQSVDINYLKAAGTSVKWQLYSFNTSTQAKGSAVEPTASNAVWGWYYDGDGTMKTTYTGMTHMGVTIEQSPEGTSGQSGTITVTSTDLPNRAIKYMLLRVYLNEQQTLYEDVIIRHFPTDNIQSIAGLWSSRTTTNWWDASTLTGNWWNTTNPRGYGIGYDGLFRARYYYNNSNMRGANNTNYTNSHDWQNQTSLTNNKKYVIQISSTSDEYVLGRPYLDGNKQSQDHVASPAFMIASQLGATTSTSPRNNQITTFAREAATHCDTYKEVDSDGTEWTGWRLPTREEVGVILRYQHANYDTMKPVMTGAYYWTLEGAAVATGVTGENNGNYTWATDWATRYSNTSYDYQYGRGNCFIRCIRDMSAQEIDELNGFDDIIEQYQNK